MGLELGNLSEAGELAPFLDFAREKGMKICSLPPGAAIERSVWHLDCDLARLSVENACSRATAQGEEGLAKRLENLLEHGTRVQHVAFVTKESGTYFFPEDIEKMVASGPKAAHPFLRTELSWLRCFAGTDGTHYWEERSSRICIVFDQDGAIPSTGN